MKAALAALLLAAPAAAQPLPSLFVVTGVQPGHALNVRAAPEPGAPVIGRLAADATGIEVTARDATGAWGAVNVGEGAGWAALRYLAAAPGGWQPGALPAGLRCFGTEPFWSLAFDAGTARLATPEGERTLKVQAILDTGVPDDPRRAVVLDDAISEATATITPAACSDGMSDRRFGLQVLTVLHDAGAPRLLSGCCSLGR